MKNVLKNTTIVLILGTLIACASPPQIQNDPNIPDNGVIILNIDNNDPYLSDPYCRPPYRVGPYCNPYPRRNHYYMDPQVEFYLRKSLDNG